MFSRSVTGNLTAFFTKCYSSKPVVILLKTLMKPLSLNSFLPSFLPLSVDLSSPRLLPVRAQFLTNKKIASQKPKSPLSDIQTNEDGFFFKLKRCHKLFLIPLPGILQM